MKTIISAGLNQQTNEQNIKPGRTTGSHRPWIRIKLTSQSSGKQMIISFTAARTTGYSLVGETKVQLQAITKITFRWTRWTIDMKVKSIATMLLEDNRIFSRSWGKDLFSQDTKSTNHKIK